MRGPRAAVLIALPAAVACAGRTSAGRDGSTQSSESSADASVEAGGDPTADSPTAPPQAIPLRGCNGDYTVPTTIGAETFPLVLDTGSATLAVAAHDCAECAAAGVSPLYEPGPGATDLHATASAAYGDGSGTWDAALFRDRVMLGGAPPALDQAVAAMSSENELLIPTACRSGSQPVAGILGLGPPQNVTAGTDAIVDLLPKAGVPKVFAVELCDEGGQAWIGGFDRGALVEEPRWTPMIDDQPFYSVTVSGIALAGEALAVDPAALPPAIVDTGGPLLYLPPPVFDALANAIAGTSGFDELFHQGPSFFASMDTCTPTSRAEIDAALPPLTLTFGAGPGAIAIEAKASESYLQPVYDDSGVEYWCTGIGTFPGDGMPSIDIGSAWLRSQVVVFDLEKHRMGFAHHASCP